MESLNWSIPKVYSGHSLARKIFLFEFADVDTDEPDEKSILLYIVHLYKACPTVPTHPFQHEHDQVSSALPGWCNQWWLSS